MKKNRTILLCTLAAGLGSGTAAAQESVVTLSECIELSHTSNPAVLNAALDVRAAQATRKEAAANWFPSVSVSGFGFNALDPLLRIGLDDVFGSSDAANNLKYYLKTSAGLSGIDTEYRALQQGYMAMVQVMQPVFAGGRIVNGNALAALGVEAAGLKSSIALRDNDDEVVKKYWTVVSLAEKEKALEQALGLVESLRKDVESAVAAGLVRESDLLQVRLKARELDGMMSKLRSGLRLAKMDLFNYVGMPYKVLELDGMSLADDFDGLQSPMNYYRDHESVAASMDEARLLEMSIEARQLEKKMAVGEGLPEIGIGAAYGYGQMVGAPMANGAVFAMVKIPVSDWSKTSRKVQRAQYEIDKARNDKEYLDRQLRLKVGKEWMDLETAWDEVGIAGDAVSLSEMIERQKEEEFAAGLCTLSELLQAQTDLQSARSTLVDAQTSYAYALAVWNR